MSGSVIANRDSASVTAAVAMFSGLATAAVAIFFGLATGVVAIFSGSTTLAVAPLGEHLVSRLRKALALVDTAAAR